MSYTPQAWANLNSSTPLSADRLTHIESGIAAVDTRFLSFGLSVGSGQTFTGVAADKSTTVQAQIDAAFTADGGTVRLPPGVFYGSFKMRPGVDLIGSGWTTVLRAMPGQTAPVVDYSVHNAYHTRLADLRVNGNYMPGRTDGVTQGNCIGINVETSQGTTSTDWMFNAAPYADAVLPDGNPVYVGATNWNDAFNEVSRVMVDCCAGTHGIYVGTNMRGTWLHDCFVYSCKQTAVGNYATDTICSNISAGGCGDGIVIGNYTQHWQNCKSWYHGIITGYTTGSGDGWRILAPTVGGRFFTSLIGCESQDNARYGLALITAGGVRAVGFTSGGDSVAGLYMQNARSCDIDIQFVEADRAQDTVGVQLDKQGGVQPVACRVRWTADVDQFASLFAGYSFTNGATAYGNDLQGVDQQRGLSLVAAYAATLTPSTGKTYLAAAWTGDLVVAAPSIEETGAIAAGEDITIVLFDSTGGHKVTWNAAYVGAQPFMTVAGQAYEFRFTYVGSAVYVQIGPAAKISKATIDLNNAEPFSKVGTWAFLANGNAWGNTIQYNSSNAQNDAATWAVDLTGGTAYTMAVNGLAFNTAAIATIDVSYDAGATFSNIGTLDFYNASIGQKRSTFTVTPPVSGRALVRFKAATRNASNTTGWFLELCKADFTS